MHKRLQGDGEGVGCEVEENMNSSIRELYMYRGLNPWTIYLFTEVSSIPEIFREVSSIPEIFTEVSSILELFTEVSSIRPNNVGLCTNAWDKWSSSVVHSLSLLWQLIMSSHHNILCWWWQNPCYSISSEILAVNISDFFYSSLQIRKMLTQIYLFSTFILQMRALQVDLDPPFPGADQPCYQEVRKWNKSCSSKFWIGFNPSMGPTPSKVISPP